jgi:phosphatidate cytidylyltransferase
MRDACAFAVSAPFAVRGSPRGDPTAGEAPVGCRGSRPGSARTYRTRLRTRVLWASAADQSQSGRAGDVAAEGVVDGRGVVKKRSLRSVQRRVLTGIVLGAVCAGVVLGGRLPFFLMMLVSQLIGQSEYYKMVLAKGHTPAWKMGLLVTATLLLTTYVAPGLADVVFPVGGTFTCIYLLFRRRKIATIADISTTFMGLFYAGFLPSFWVRLHGVSSLAGVGTSTAATAVSVTTLGGIVQRLWPQAILRAPILEIGPLLVFWSWLSCAFADIGAFFVGKYFGRTHISSISPKKTLEGAIAGFICSAGVSMLGAFLLQWPMWQLTGALYGMTIGMLGLCGDLFASSFKRDVGWKDSGQLFPGHGGILDRADSYVLTAPLVYYFATLVLPLLGMR